MHGCDSFAEMFSALMATCGSSQAFSRDRCQTLFLLKEKHSFQQPQGINIGSSGHMARKSPASVALGK
jgi:hypothetical protein